MTTHSQIIAALNNNYFTPLGFTPLFFGDVTTENLRTASEQGFIANTTTGKYDFFTLDLSISREKRITQIERRFFEIKIGAALEEEVNTDNFETLAILLDRMLGLFNKNNASIFGSLIDQWNYLDFSTITRFNINERDVIFQNFEIRAIWEGAVDYSTYI